MESLGSIEERAIACGARGPPGYANVAPPCCFATDSAMDGSRTIPNCLQFLPTRVQPDHLVPSIGQFLG
jgi:hypothetical protein